MADTFDPAAREAELRGEAESWDVAQPRPAEPGEIPTLDVGRWFVTRAEDALQEAAASLRHACETVGFHQLVGHGIAQSEIDGILEVLQLFHALPAETKAAITMDRPGWPVQGVGYMPIGERKLPRRDQGNRNAAFIMKSDVGVTSEHNQWLTESTVPGFRATVERFAERLERLALRLIPLYAVALDLDSDFFDEAFIDPFWRLRLTHYPPDEELGATSFGIAPHVDTTFLTLLLQDGPGLTVHHAPTDNWIQVPVVDDAFVVNTGELLRQWSNDRFLSTRHFANNHQSQDRHSIPFFFNANPDHVMTCLPSCTSADRPPRYPPMSYRASQAAVQNE